ncbi:hypothetical protein SAY87_015567 [Trapa incisa]|uniref:Bet v I/Major latex protein domain-containing protein n=1 Tax=Trapa incisa TaxID=236973 RepID=A0AAN7QWP0_9MYRT|nr:hypothetical protein SAY87_015567 [Trapa incisa]
MVLRGKLSAEIEIKSHPENYFERMKEELHHLPDAVSGIHGVEVHEGDFKTHGSKSWSYTLDGKKETFKERFQIDEASWSVTMVAVDGNILKRYKSYMVLYKIVPATIHEPPTVKVTLAYEKYKEADADPHKEMEFMITMVEEIDKHLLAHLLAGPVISNKAT